MNAKRSSDSSPTEGASDAAGHPDLVWARARQEQARDVEDALREVLGAADHLRPAMARRMGVGVNDLRALEHLIAGPLGPVDIAARLDLTTAATTVLLDRLEAAGHVRRLPHPTDARRRVVELTETGWVDALAVVRPLVEALDVPAAALSPSDREVVARYLHQVAAVLRTTLNP